MAPARQPTIAIIGGGAAGIAIGTQLKRAGYREFTIYERTEGVAGTWHDNRYPGAGCDVPSHLYCFSFAPNPDWEQKFALQPEIERYFQRCVEDAGLGPHLRFGTEITHALFDEASGAWTLRTARGDQLVADVVISATGQLNRPTIPALPGLETFGGTQLHSARWDHACDATGRRVVVIGNGASAVQLVPRLAAIARQVTVLQRSPSYVLRRGDRRYRAWERWVFRNVPLVRRGYRALIYGSLEARFSALHPGSLLARITRRMALRYLHDIVTDPVLRVQLTPRDPVGCKRILISDDWYQTLIQPHVALVTSPIERVVPEGVLTRDGTTHAADLLVFATGFQSTGFLAPIEVVGRGGVTLAEAWRTGAEAHLGITVSGFPNLFLLYGPNTNLGHSSILFMIECQARYIVRCLDALARREARWLDVRREAMARSNAQLRTELSGTAWAADCHNWYKTDDGKITNNWSGRTTRYWWRTRRPKLSEFELGG